MITASLAALALLFLAWVVYPLVLVAASRIRGPSVQADPSHLPSVDVIIATRDSPDTVSRRVDDIRRARYPAALLHVIVTVDARSNHAAPEHEGRLGERAQVVPGDAPGGKTAALNAGVRAATADILVFADSHQSFEPNTIAELVRFLDDGRYGAVSGALCQDTGERVMDLYSRYEMVIRGGQSAIHSIVSTSGSIQAVRRALWEPLPVDLICDDLYLTMRLVQRGHRVGFCPSARAIDSRRFTKMQHFQRKVRTLTGLFQFLAYVPTALLPWKNPIWIHFVCHKLMRLVTPYLALVVVLGLAWVSLRDLGPVLLTTLGVLAVVALAIVLARPAWRKPLAVQVGWVLLLLAAPVVAMLNGMRKRWQVWPSQSPLHDA